VNYLDLGSLIRLLSWFIPVPFMILYHVKTDKLDFLQVLAPYATFFFFAGFLLFGDRLDTKLGFRPELLAFYAATVGLSFMYFSNKLEVPKALSIAVCLTFFASAYWEVPYWIYTIYIRGYIDQAMPLHLLYFFPLAFVVSKIEVRVDWKNVLLIASNMVVSTLSIFLLVGLGSDVFWTYNNPPNLWLINEVTWFVIRIFCFVTLYWIYYNGRIRNERTKTES